MDLLMLIQLINAGGESLVRWTGIAKKMQEEGRDKMTPDEWATLDQALADSEAAVAAARARRGTVSNP